VRASIPNPDLALPAGMFMHVTLELESREAVTVPETAIVPQGGKSYVYVVNGEKAERRAVALGIRQPGSVEITEGVAAGEVVVISGVQKLRNGAPVRVVKTGGTAG
jgi:membrane fusion protein (multidrug efflux system)